MMIKKDYCSRGVVDAEEVEEEEEIHHNRFKPVNTGFRPYQREIKFVALKLFIIGAKPQ